MEIRYKDILLRDMIEADIDDWLRWYNEDTAWSDWDAPDEELERVEAESYRAEQLRRLSVPLEGMRSFFEIATADGHHIGMVTSYAIGPDFKWLSWRDARERGDFSFTVGIDICDSRFWGRGYGTRALAAFIRYLLEERMGPLYLQTWSGNERMLRSAAKLGFVECFRRKGDRFIRGGVYDSITLRLDETQFARFLNE